MSKLSADDKFFDLSDYGRLPAKQLAKILTKTRFTPKGVTLVFGIVGLLAVYAILKGYLILAGILLILKSIIDAADGELARMKKTPSYSGRYLDSVFDIILNFLFLLAIASIANQPLWLGFAAFCAIQLQGTLYNYYYVILRHSSEGGDATSKVLENETPVAMQGEEQWLVNLLFKTYKLLYGAFDKAIYHLDKKAVEVQSFPKEFMTIVSMYGLGFHLLIMAVLLSIHLEHFINPVLITFTIPLFLLVSIRKKYIS